MEQHPMSRSAALALLGLPERASARDITRAYRRLVKQTHPDAAGATGYDAPDRFAAVIEAYQLLRSAPGESLVGSQAAPVPVRVTVRRRGAASQSIIVGPARVTPIRPSRGRRS